MSDTRFDQKRIEQFIQEIRSSRKYKHLALPDSTLYHLINQEASRFSKPEEAFQSVRKKLHTIVAPYLGEPDYSLLQQEFHAAAGNRSRLKELCLQTLTTHASTRERIPFQQEFYSALFQKTGQPPVLCDLACGFNPFAFPWMTLPESTVYYAYDIHGPRVSLINTFFQAWGIQGQAIQQDILVEPPTQKADMALFFKEAHRFEERRKGCNRSFWQALNVRYLLVSLPSRNLTATHCILGRQRDLVRRTLEGLSWPVEEIIFPDEIVFCIQPVV